MVMAIGILTIVSLFPAGLDQNARSIADTQAAFFAEEVFAGLRARSETNWLDLSGFELPVSAPDMWSNPTNVIVTGLTNMLGAVMPRVNVYKNGSFEDYALRYRLAIETNGLIKSATLWVWPGEFGRLMDANVFYTEFFRWKP